MVLNKDNKDMLYLFIIQAMNYALPILLMPYLMIKLGAKSYGLIGLSSAVIQYLILFVDFGFNMSATKRVAINKKNKYELSKIFFTTVYAKTILMLLSILFFIIVYNIPKFHEYKLALLCSLPALLGNTYTFTWFFQGIGEIKYLTILSMICRLLVLPSIFIFVNAPEDYVIAIFINSIIFVLIAIISIYWIFNKKIIDRVRFNSALIKSEMKESFPFFLSTSSISMYTQLFVLILGLVATPAAVGIYTAADKIVRSICLLFYTPINQVYYPKIANISSNDKQTAFIILYNIFKLSMIAICVFSILLFFTSSYIELLLGSDYAGIAVLLKILSPLPIFVVAGGIAGQMGLIAYINSDLAKYLFQKVYIIAGLGSVIVVSVLAFMFLEKGAAIASLLTEGLVGILMCRYFIKLNGFKKSI